MRKSQKILSVFLAFLCLLFSAFSVSASPYAQLEKGGSGGWLNVTRPLTEEDFKGKAVLLDFWTYGCINCIQIIPDLEYLEKKFGNKLLIIGVHSAKFEGESGNSRILFAAKRFGLKHPVINDADFAIWKSYGVNAWPTQILLGPDGQEIARWSGEGHRNEIAKTISGIQTRSERIVPLIKDRDKFPLSFPSRVQLWQNKLIIADSGHNQIVIANKSGHVEQRIGSGSRLNDGTSFSSAGFNAPRGFAVKGQKIYVADTGNHKLREINLATRRVTTLAGNGKRGSPGQLASPWDVEFIDDDKLAIANAGTHQILCYDLRNQELSVLAGSGEEDIKDGPALSAALAQPSGLSFYDGVLYFVDAESSSLRQLKDGKVTTLIGTGLFDFGFKDGKYPKARLQHPQGLYADGNRIFIADTYNNAVRIYDLKSGELKTQEFKYYNVNEPGDVYIDGLDLYLANTNFHEIARANVGSRILSEIPVR